MNASPGPSSTTLSTSICFFSAIRQVLLVSHKISDMICDIYSSLVCFCIVGFCFWQKNIFGPIRLFSFCPQETSQKTTTNKWQNHMTYFWDRLKELTYKSNNSKNYQSCIKGCKTVAQSNYKSIPNMTKNKSIIGLLVGDHA